MFFLLGLKQHFHGRIRMEYLKLDTVFVRLCQSCGISFRIVIQVHHHIPNSDIYRECEAR
jgi:hypothetical protein